MYRRKIGACKRCGEDLVKPGRNAQWECEGCGIVVADENLDTHGPI